MFIYTCLALSQFYHTTTCLSIYAILCSCSDDDLGNKLMPRENLQESLYFFNTQNSQTIFSAFRLASLMCDDLTK